MNILLIHQYFLEKNDGGGSRFNEMVKLWNNSGHNITVISGMVHYSTGLKPQKYSGKLFYRDDNYYSNTDVVRCHVSQNYNTNFLGRLWGYLSFVCSGTWGGLFKVKKKHDIILVTSPPLFVGIVAYILSKIKKIPFIFEIRDLWPESAIDTGVLKNKFLIKTSLRFEKFMYSKAQKINVLTPAFKKSLEIKGVDPEKICFIPNAADFKLAEATLKSFNPKKFRTQLGLEKKFVITYVGAHGVANHLIQIIDVAQKLIGTNVIFQFIGDGMKKLELMTRVNDLKLNEHFRFVDNIPKNQVFKYILSSDVGTSILKKADTFKTIYSNKTFDYMSCKKPILLLIDGVSRELVESAKCGIYAEPENTEHITRAIQKLMTLDKRELDSLGESGYNYAKKYFDREKLANQYIDIMYNI